MSTSARIYVARLRRRDLVTIGVLALAGIGIPLWLATAAGAVGLPNTDDWVYMRGAESLHSTGGIVMLGHTAASVGQLVMVQPLLWLSGGEPWAFTAFGLAMGLLGIVATYLLARRFVGTSTAALVVLLLVVFPGFGRATATFLTDVPAFALSATCLLLGVRWLQGDGSRATLVASIAIGLAGISIREFAVAAPMAILISAWARNRVDERVLLAASSLGLGAGIVVVLRIGASVPGHSVPVTPESWRLLLLGPMFTTLAAALLPAIVIRLGRTLATIRAGHVILGSVFVVLMLVLPYGSLVGNFWMTNGFGGNALLVGVREPVIGGAAWALSGQLATLAAILLTTLAVSWIQQNLDGVRSVASAVAQIMRIARSPTAPLLLFLLGYAAELVIFASVGVMLDRYLFPMVPIAAILLLREPTGHPQRAGVDRSHALAHGAVAWLAVSALIIAANSFAYDAGRWHAGDAAVALGYEAATVDAGYEWVGDHATGAHDADGRDDGPMWYDDWFLPQSPCAVVSNSQEDHPGYELIRHDPSAYRQYLFIGPWQSLYLYGSVAPSCPPLPVAIEAAIPSGYTAAVAPRALTEDGGGS